MAKSTAIVQPNLGLFLNRDALSVPQRGLQDGNNFRIKNGRLTNYLLGWTVFGSFTLNGPVRLIENFVLRSGAEHLIFATNTDVYRYVSADGSVVFLTPIFAAGTADVDASDPAEVTIAGQTLQTEGVKEGDQISFGAADENDPEAVWYTIASVDSETILTLDGPVAGAPLTGSDYTIRKLFTATQTNHWDSAVFLNDAADDTDYIFFTNGVDPVFRWDGSSAQVEFPDLTPILTVKHLAVYSNMMTYTGLETTDGLFETSFINSHPGAPTQVASGLAEQFLIHDGEDAIEDVVPLGDNLVFYSARHIVNAQFVGDPLLFVFRAAATGMGVVGPRFVANFGDYHQFLSQDTQYHFDGNSVREIGNHVWQVVVITRDAPRKELGFHFFDEEQGELLWVLPTVNDTEVNEDPTLNPPQYSYTEHYLEDVNEARGEPIPFSRRDFPFISAGKFRQQSTLTYETATVTYDQADFRYNDVTLSNAFPIALVGDMDGNVWQLNTSTRKNDEDLVSFVTFPRMALGDGRMRGLISRVYPFARSPIGVSDNLRVTVQMSDHANGQATIIHTDLFSLALEEGGHFTTPYRRGRFVEVKFGTNESEPWELSGYDYDAKVGGRR